MNRTIVIKIEIATLCDAQNLVDKGKLDRLALLVANLHNSGKKVILVSSGAIALGMKKLGVKIQPDSSIHKQAIAAIGQAELIKTYQKHLGEYNQTVAQVLITKDVTDNVERAANATNTFRALLDMNIIPVVNENDAVSTDDILLEDNYPLALSVSRLANASMMLIKSETDNRYILLSRSRKKYYNLTEDEVFPSIEELSQCTNNELVTGSFPDTFSQLNEYVKNYYKTI